MELADSLLLQVVNEGLEELKDKIILDVKIITAVTGLCPS
jgi:hypothetical protein